MQRTASVPGKIILSGEYAMLFGKPGIAVPSSKRFTAVWKDEPGSLLIVEWPGMGEQPAWIKYIWTVVTMAEKLGEPSHGTLTIQNELPLGKGMGSSTALVLAVTRALFGDASDTHALTIEHQVNPGHSGMDFAVCTQGKPIRFQREQLTQILDMDLSFLKDATLIDTGEPNEQTMELVDWVKSRERDLQDAFAIIGDCTEALLAGEHPLTVFPDHHRAQLALGVVPEQVHELIVKIEQAGGAAKVIGAGARTGGGGMVLAVHPDRAALAEAIGDAYPVSSL